MAETQVEKRPNDTELTRCTACYRPNVDILETPSELTVVADMPGVDRDGIDVHFENGELTIHGRVSNRYANETNVLLTEFGIGDFYRTFHVSEQVDPRGIHAEYRGGVLTVHVPKSEAVKPRKIAVKVE